MNQELMTLDFWQDTVIYESKTFPVGTLACDALNVPVNTIAKINEQCEKINLLLGILNAGQDASALCPIATEAALTMLDILSQTPPFSYMNISKHRERIEKVFTVDYALKQFQLEKEDAYVFGDSSNDLTMFRCGAHTITHNQPTSIHFYVILLFIFFENMYCLLFESSLYVALIVIVHDICLQYTVYHFIQTTTMLIWSLTS